MPGPNTISTKRLVLRPVQPSDEAAIKFAASQHAIADTMISIPHPYPEDHAAHFIRSRQEMCSVGKGFTFVISEKETSSDSSSSAFVGIAEIRDVEKDEFSSQAELSFWIAVEKWGKGYMSEAVQAVIDYGFDVLKVNRLYAYHMVRNPACGRVLEKNGFKKEGVMRQRVMKWGKYEDVAFWAMLARDRRELR